MIKDKSWSPVTDYHPIIPNIYEFPQTHKPGITSKPIISGIRCAPYKIVEY